MFYQELFNLLISWLFSRACKNACDQSLTRSWLRAAWRVCSAARRARVHCLWGRWDGEAPARQKHSGTLSTASKRWPYPVSLLRVSALAKLSDRHARRASRCVDVFHRCRGSIIGLSLTHGGRRRLFKIASTLLKFWSVFLHFLQLQTYQTYLNVLIVLLDDRSATALISWLSAHMEPGWLNVSLRNSCWFHSQAYKLYRQ